MIPAAELRDFARRYTQAWCSGDPARVAECYAPQGALSINSGPPSIGRTAIAAAARDFMETFPDMQVSMDDVVPHNDRSEYHWTLTGTNTGRGGTGKRVRISGFESWTLDADGLIAESRGTFDAAEYQRQLECGFDG
jgi:uncharacterized protein (TIGR02246 family)